MLLFIIFLCAVGGLMFGDYVYTSRRFPENVYIDNINVSGLTAGEAIKKLESADVDASCLSFIILYTSTESYEFSPSEAGAFIRPRASVYKAFETAYEQSYFKGLVKRAIKEPRRLTLPLQLGLFEEKIGAVLSEIASKEDVASVEARCLLLGGGKYRLTKEKIGFGIDRGATVVGLLSAFRSGKKSAPLVIKALVPRVLRKDLVRRPPVKLIAKYRTKYGTHDSPNRIYNIKLIAAGVDNYILLSGEAFSMVSNMGQTNKERGFKEAFVIIKGELVPQYGGGACQVATTVFNTAMLADLEIVKRHNHAIYFFIYPLGRDAAVYAGSLDLQILNNTGYPIMFKAGATDKDLTVSIYGTPTGKSIYFSPAKILVKSGAMTKEVSREGFSFEEPFITVVEKTISTADGSKTDKSLIKSYYRHAGENGSVNIVRPEPQ